MWAVINDSGATQAAVTHSSGGISVTESTSFANGGYRLTFPRAVTDCSYQVTTGDEPLPDAEGTYPSPGFAGVAPLQPPGSPNQLKVLAAASNGTTVDLDFFIDVFC